ncbi:MAG TPA: hypothetical protein VNU26_15965 [Mycobacteriales bacterium]|nr:hypothetical protein [Mycobacteriales bacterium]
MSSAGGAYWSVEACGWVASPCPDALATPWSGAELPVQDDVHPPRDGWDVLRTMPRVAGLPAQRASAPAQAPSPR